MKKRILITVSVVLLLIAVLCLFTFQSSQQDLPHEAVTDIYPFTLSDKAGSTITIYICQTRYHPETIQVTGLNVDAISSVFDIENTVLQKEFDTYGHPAAIYQGKNHSYLCWTASPNVSGVLEYETGSISEDDLIKIAESVYQNPENKMNDSQG